MCARPGDDPEDARLKQAIDLANQLIGFPRHLSQHVGGFVLTQTAAERDLAPIVNAAMPDRTFIEWDKDDIDVLKLMKVDILALGMLTAIQQGHRHAEGRGRRWSPSFGMACLSRRTSRTCSEMCSAADTLGVFQIESRAQMNMLPRLRPREVLRPRHRGGDRAARPDPGRHGAPLSAPEGRAGESQITPSPGPPHDPAGRAQGSS